MILRPLSLSFVWPVLLAMVPAFAGDDFSSHRAEVQRIEAAIQKLDTDVAEKQSKGRSTRDADRRENAIQGIIEIHSELISLRSDLDLAMRHIRAEHLEEGQESNILAEVQVRKNRRKPSGFRDPIDLSLDKLFHKIQSKYASFLQQADDENHIFNRIDRVEKTQRGARQSEEAKVYLRKKSRVKISK